MAEHASVSAINSADNSNADASDNGIQITNAADGRASVSAVNAAAAFNTDSSNNGRKILNAASERASVGVVNAAAASNAAASDDGSKIKKRHRRMLFHLRCQCSHCFQTPTPSTTAQKLSTPPPIESLLPPSKPLSLPTPTPPKTV
jgi:hypothetical protein